MASFRPFPLSWQSTLDSGAINAGGSVIFSLSGGSTPSPAYGEPALSTNNGSTLTLGSDGRFQVDVWLDASINYRVRILDADSVQIDLIDNVQSPTTAAVSVPDPADGDDGDVITTDGVSYSLQTPLYVPDPTGHADEILGTDGTNLAWEAKATEATLPDGGVTVAPDDDVITIGDYVIQGGSGTLPASGSRTSSVGITFPLEMDSCSHVDVTFGNYTTDGDGYVHFIIPVVQSMTGAGCTVVGCMNIFPGTIDSTISFTYKAWGRKAVA